MSDDNNNNDEQEQLDLFEMLEWEKESLPMYPDFGGDALKNKTKDKCPPPFNNIGRKYCWWCGRATTMKPLFTSVREFCEVCKK